MKLQFLEGKTSSRKEQIGDVPSTSVKFRRHKKRKRKQSKRVSPVEIDLIPNTPCNDHPAPER